MESFNGTPGEELLSHELFVSFEEACWVIDRWRLDYNHQLDYQTPAAYAAGCVLPASATPQPPEHSSVTNPNPLTQPSAKTGGSHGLVGRSCENDSKHHAAQGREADSRTVWASLPIHGTRGT